MKSSYRGPPPRHLHLASGRGCVRGLLLAVLLATGNSGCKDLERFDTGPDEAYCGTIIDSDFVRSGFEAGLGMSLTLDTRALDTQPGTLSTDDAETGPCSPEPLFADAPLRASSKLLADPLSQLEFGAERDFNFVAWADSTCQGSALSIVSLMHDGNVEVRLLRRGSGTQPMPTETTAEGDFAVFQLRKNDCS